MLEDVHDAFEFRISTRRKLRRWLRTLGDSDTAVAIRFAERHSKSTRDFDMWLHLQILRARFGRELTAEEVDNYLLEE